MPRAGGARNDGEGGVAPVKISGKEFGEYTGDRKAYGKAFAKYYKDNIAGTSVVSPVLGEVKFFNSAIDETIAKNIPTPENLKYIAAVPQIIATSNNVTEEQVKHYKADIIAAWRVNGQADIDGDVRNVSVVVLEDRRHNKYYTFDARKEKGSENTAVQGGNQSLKAETAYDSNIAQTDVDVNNTFYQFAEYDGLKASKSIADVKRLMRELKADEEVRLLYDTKKKYWFVANADNTIHEEILEKAFQQGYYPEFRSIYDAKEYFAENQTVDDEYLFSFKAIGYSHPSERDIMLQHVGADGYRFGYVLDNGDGSGSVLYARAQGDIDDTPLKYVNGNTKIYERQYDDDGFNSKLVDVTPLYQTGDGELNLEVTPMAERVPTAEQKRKSRMIYPVMGQYEPAKKLITLFKGRDKTTLTHELLHHYLPIYLIVVIIRS